MARLAAEAVFQQTDAAKTQPKTGNRLIDMLNENGIPLGSSLKGIQQAIKTQKEIENSDPGEQVILTVTGSAKGHTYFRLQKRFSRSSKSKFFPASWQT